VNGARVLVTGAGGFLGRHLCRRLRTSGAVVHAVSRGEAPPHGDASRWWQAELESDHEARELLRAVKPEIVFHLGGLTHAAPDLALVLPTFRSLLTSTVGLLIAVTEHGCRRLVLVGSVEEPAGAWDTAPASPYGAAKWAAGAYGRMFHALYATPVVIARMALAYGPGQADRKVIPATILSLLRGEPPRVSSGTRRWDLVYIDDAIEALVGLAERPGLEGATLDVGSGTTRPLREVIERLTQMIDPALVPMFGVIPERPWGGGAAADAAATEARLGWRATTSLETGLERTIAWYRARTGRSGGQGVAA
jgi:UDP-glucose 4-epimerase